MKPKILVKPIFLGVFCLFYLLQKEASAGVDTSGAYPQVVFSNNFPSEGEKITITWILGIHHDACVPKYETSVAQSVSNGVINLYLNYKELKSTQEEVGCLQVLTSYGPRFEVGPLKANYVYKVYIDSPLVREFRVTPNKYPYPIITPHEPHVGDNVSVQWVLGEDSVNCIMQYDEKITRTFLTKSNPPIHTFFVSYKEAPVEYFACLPRPTLYGPTFDLGTVQAGEYVIYYDGDTATVAKFSVFAIGDKPVFKVISEQPKEGDSLKIKLVLGNGSSSCAPGYTTRYDMVTRADNTYECKLNYETIPNTNAVCTKDYVPFGPEWVFTDVKAGTYVFRCSNDSCRVFVQKQRQVPEFSYVTISGTITDGLRAVENENGSIHGMYVPQCTVMVVFDNIVAANKPIGYLDSIVNENEKITGGISTLAVSRNMFMAVTNESGVYTINNVPSSLLLKRSYIVAVKDGRIGSGTVPDTLKEEMLINFSLLDVELFIDAMRYKYGGTEDVVSLLKQLGVNNASFTKEIPAVLVVKPAILSVTGGFVLGNPENQKMSIAAFTINGKRIWSHNTGILTEGNHFFALPQTSTGVFLLTVRGEKFELSKVITVKK